MPQPPTAEQALDAFGIENLVDHILEGGTFRDLAEKLGISRSAIYRWVGLDADRSTRVHSARVSSAMDLAEEARVVLRDKDIPIDRGREIASHCRWESRIRDPKQFGDKVQVDQNVTQLDSLSDSQLLERVAMLESKLSAPMPEPLPLDDEPAS